MRDWQRGAIVAAAGLLAGLAAGFLVWGREGAGARFAREYADGERVRVKTVIDGDTVVLEDGLHVRYRGCDTPEVYRFVRDPEPFAEEASDRNRALVGGAWVTLRLPPSSSPALDAHGRVLADVVLERGDGARPESVGETLVREGLARANLQDVRGPEADRLREAEAAARDAKAGMWSGEKPQVEGFAASRNGKCIHRPGCVYMQRVSPANLMRFNTIEAALSTGRSRCPTCLAPQSDAPGRASPAPGGPAEPSGKDAAGGEPPAPPDKAPPRPAEPAPVR